MTTYVDINCDMGESFGAYKLGMDDEVIPFISSANIACGFHAGDPNVMNHTVKLAKEFGVGVGAHPGFPDLLGFGRRNMDVEKHDLQHLILYQIGALNAFCQKHGVPLQHIKPHGSLNNMADTDKRIAEAIVNATLEVQKELPIFVKPHSMLQQVAEEKGARIVLELFADRAYDREKRLVSRKIEGSLITDANEVAERVLRMVTDKKITAIDGTELNIEGDSICVHGDTPTALDMIGKIRHKLETEGVVVAPVSDWLNR